MKFNYAKSNTHRLLPFAMGLAILTAGCGTSPEYSQNNNGDILIQEGITDEAGPAAQEQQAQESRVIAIVDGKEVTQDDLAIEINMLVNQLQGSIPAENLAQMHDEIQHHAMENLIVKTLLRNQVERDGITVDQEELSETIEQLKATLPPGATLDEYLDQMDMKRDEFIEDVSKDLQINKLLEEKISEAGEPTEDEIRDFYEQNMEHFEQPETVSARHILISIEEGADDSAREDKRTEAEEIRQLLIDGADFTEMAAEVSDCPSAMQGGNLGNFTRGQMVPSFEEAAFSRPIGEIGPVVETQFGYHVIQVESREPAQTITLDEGRERITEALLSEKQRTVLQNYISSLRDSADIQFTDNQ